MTFFGPSMTEKTMVEARGRKISGSSRPAVGVVWGRRGLRDSTAGHGRQEQAARPALLWAATSRKQGFGHWAVFTLVPVQS